MSLVKKETICPSCDIQYILVLNESDVENLTCCPFCSFVMTVEEQEDDE